MGELVVFLGAEICNLVILGVDNGDLVFFRGSLGQEWSVLGYFENIEVIYG